VHADETIEGIEQDYTKVLEQKALEKDCKEV
jgi:hypothetical protein